MQRGRTLVCVAAALCIATAAHAQRRSDTVVLTVGGSAGSQFCTPDGYITVVHGTYQTAYGGARFGGTRLDGPQSYYLGPGNAHIQPGCYRHVIANSSVYGTGRLTSTIWYNATAVPRHVQAPAARPQPPRKFVHTMQPTRCFGAVCVSE